ncbi:serine hydrolase [Aerophototrophica crusticola]|uniref:Serine hydrolase n=1 Tax=Aerophototrophica crusticola TaxID=1709002 RepID=A0A858RAE3_9PROT|nr:serine hydrolase [Rhodospirillaceae bacterium B3]
MRLGRGIGAALLALALLARPAVAETRTELLDRTLAALVADKTAPVSGVALVVLDKGREAFANAAGLAVIDPADPARQQALDVDTPVRVASISKLAVAITALRLVEEGKLTLDGDAGAVLGFALRNPHWPDRPITLRHLLTHTSSLRDGEVYALPVQHSLEELVRPGGPWDKDGSRWAKPDGDGRDRGPGAWFSYANINLGVVATMMERVTGERFDSTVDRVLFRPLGIQAGFDVRRLPDPAFAKLAPVYRKVTGEVSDPGGTWSAQVDDHRGVRPDGFVSPFGVTATLPLSAYQPGRNATTLAPQGGLRISARGLARMLRVLLDRGTVDGVRVLRPETVDAMLAPAWAFPNGDGDTERGLYQRWGLGVHCLNTGEGDRIAPGAPMLCGHLGDAYGLIGGALVDPAGGWGFVYLVTGTSLDSADASIPPSALTRWETTIGRAVLEGRAPGR